MKAGRPNTTAAMPNLQLPDIPGAEFLIKKQIQYRDRRPVPLPVIPGYSFFLSTGAIFRKQGGNETLSERIVRYSANNPESILLPPLCTSVNGFKNVKNGPLPLLRKMNDFIRRTQA